MTSTTISRDRATGEYVLRAEAVVPFSIDHVFAFFSAAENLGRITPPELGFVIRTALPIAMHRGTLIDYTVSLWGVPLPWRTEITQWAPPHEFEDTQLRGPYAQWIHRHRFRADPAGTVIEDVVRYRLPLGQLGRLAHPLIKRQLRRIFEYRQRSIQELLELSVAGGHGATPR